VDHILCISALFAQSAFFVFLSFFFLIQNNTKQHTMAAPPSSEPATTQQVAPTRPSMRRMVSQPPQQNTATRSQLDNAGRPLSRQQQRRVASRPGPRGPLRGGMDRQPVLLTEHERKTLMQQRMNQRKPDVSTLERLLKWLITFRDWFVSPFVQVRTLIL
jgi:hypothetical protein